MRGSVVVQLNQYAIAAARDVQGRIDSLRREMQELAARAAETQAALELVQGSVARLDSFEAESGGDYRCPFCWVEEGIHAKLDPIPSSDSSDLFRCEHCRREIEIE
jgi:hypothetical protein